MTDKRKRVDASPPPNSIHVDGSSSSSSGDAAAKAPSSTIHDCFPFLYNDQAHDIYGQPLQSGAAPPRAGQQLHVVDWDKASGCAKSSHCPRCTLTLVSTADADAAAESKLDEVMIEHLGQREQKPKGWVVHPEDNREHMTAQLVEAGFIMTPNSYLVLSRSCRTTLDTDDGSAFALCPPLSDARMALAMAQWIPESARRWQTQPRGWTVSRAARRQLYDLISFLGRLIRVSDETRWHLGDWGAEPHLLRWPLGYPACKLPPLLPLPVNLRCHVASFLPLADIFRLARTSSDMQTLLTRSASFAVPRLGCRCEWYITSLVRVSWLSSPAAPGLSDTSDLCGPCGSALRRLQQRALTHALGPGHAAWCHTLLQKNEVNGIKIEARRNARRTSSDP